MTINFFTEIPFYTACFLKVQFFIENDSGQGITEYGAVLAFVALLIGTMWVIMVLNGNGGYNPVYIFNSWLWSICTNMAQAAHS